MKNIKDVIKLIRMKHWIKNLLIFIPAFFEKNIFEAAVMKNLLWGFLCFSVLSSIIYVINDLRDVEKDRMHEIKRMRPIASGAVSVKKAWLIIVLLSVICIFALWKIDPQYIYAAAAWCLVYLCINIAYSMGLKDIPIVDIAILASGFIIRVLFGAAVCNVTASSWLCLTVMAFALYMGIGKRRNELSKTGGNTTRTVLKYYDVNFLDKNMTMVTTLGIVFYSLWAGTVISNSLVIWTVPLVIIIIMKYELIIKGNSYGDPVEVLLSDKILMGLVAVFAIIMIFLLYGC